MRLKTLALTLLLFLSLPVCGPSPRGLLPPFPPSAPGPSRLWQDATIFRPVQDQITAARHRVWAEMYEFGREDIAGWLVAARHRGLDVRVIIDPSVVVSARMAVRLRAEGIPVRPYPLDDRLHQIDHVKLLLTESHGLVGGMNWGQASARNHDYAIEGTAAPWIDRLAEIFEQDWALADGQGGAATVAPGPSMASIAQTKPGEGIRELLAMNLAVVRWQVRAEVFVLTDPDVMAALAACRRRGVAVRILLDPNQDVNRRGFQLLRQTGVEARWYPAAAGAKLHAKAGLFDDRLLVGSANWSRSGLSHNHELDAQTLEPLLTGAFASRFEADWAASNV